ncbi:hypothetical protein LIER_37253 [Lithospermum erythrorhizon]|uniref:Uncharacterized protein n=1 Tax=Lithospermum erythrorhizon TaxID=34254 RepID=A0AAV3PJP9_LITER
MRPGRYDNGGDQVIDERLLLYCHSGRPTTMVKERYWMIDKEWQTTQMYILCNTPEVTLYLEEYHDMIGDQIVQQLCPQ